jgi:prolyl 4-hydroxylase
VVSTTICVDHSLDSPWPLHIENIDGDVRQINLEPGELVLYEGARLAHGRPYPLDGDYYAALFVHYHPVVQAKASTGNT